MVSALRFLIGGILTLDGSIFKGRIARIIVASSILQQFQYLLLGQNEPCEQSGGGVYVLRSKGEGNRHRKKAEMKSKIGQGAVKSTALEVQHQVPSSFHGSQQVDIRAQKFHSYCRLTKRCIG